MADRYWVGGTGSWDSVAGTKWAATSGGVGGLPIPTSADDVFFDSASGAVSILNGEPVNCNNLNFTGFTGTFNGSGGTLNIFGSLTAAATVTWSHTGTLNFSGSSVATLRSGGKSLGPITISKGVGGEVTLQDALVSISAITVNTGTFNTDIYNLTATSISSNNSSIRAINLGSSTVTLSTTTPLVFTTSTNLTFNAGTSTIILPANITTFNPTNSNLTLYNLTFTNTTVATRTFSYTGNYIYNRLTVAGPASTGVMQVVFVGSNTFNDGLATSGTAGNRRVWFRSETVAIARTLTINGAGSLTDADFRDLYIIGTGAPISGTRIGDLRGCSGITFSTPKTVYYYAAAGNSWSSDTWALTSFGPRTLDAFPLAQDTVVFQNVNPSDSATVTLDSAIPYTGSVVTSGRTDAINFHRSATFTVYGNWTNGASTTFSGSAGIIFSGRKTQTITSAGSTFSSPITIDSYEGTVQLADALNTNSNTITVTNGTFDTKNYNVTAVSLASNNSNVRAINFGSSTITLSGSTSINFTTSTNLTFNAGTSTINCTGNTISFYGGKCIFYNVLFSSTAATNLVFNDTSTFNDLTIVAPASTGFKTCNANFDQNILGTLTLSGASPIRRIFVRSSSVGSTVNLTVANLVASNCDFRDIKILGAAAGTVTTGTGDCGGNSGIVFPAPKTVYANLGGAQNWSSNCWAASSGGIPNLDNFPLAQDTAVFNNTSTTTSISINAFWNIGTVDMSARTNAFTWGATSAANYHGDWKFGTGVTHSSSSLELTFCGTGTKTITSNGVTFNCPVTIDCFSGTVQLTDALNSTRALNLTSGTFDASSYNVTIESLNTTDPTKGKTLKMGSGTWTLSGISGIIWNANNLSTLYKGTADIILSGTGTAVRTFNGAGFSYNKLTIGGTTGTSTLTITGNNQFTEIASTKTVAHTIALGTTIQTFGKWSVTGTAGNVVTVTGTGTNHVIAGARVSGVNYLAMGSIGFSTTTEGEFYAGANSTGTNATIIKTAAPAPVTRYWVGGTGTWNATTTTNWSASSGGPGGASVPTSADAVIFDSASNATAYTVTCTATKLRCGSLTMAGPASGNVTWTGNAQMSMHGNVSLSATGITQSYTGVITLSGSTTGNTFTTNGITFQANVGVSGFGCGWSLGSALTTTVNMIVNIGSFDLAGYNLSANRLISNVTTQRSINLNNGTLTLTGSDGIDFGTTAQARETLTFNSGTSQINCSATSPTFSGNNKAFYNVAFTSASTGAVTLNGANTFNNLSFTGITSAGLKNVSLTADQTINGTLTLSAGTDATMRTFVRSNTIGTTRTLTCAAVASLKDIDFRDITIAGAAAPVSGTRLGDCKGNSGITFDAAKTVYRRSTTATWSFASGWTDNPGGAPNVNNFPLAQDTVVFTDYAPLTGGVINLDAAYNIGTIDMSARTTNTMTLVVNQNPSIYGNWINGTGTTLSGTGFIFFNGRNTGQTITSAGRTFTQSLSITVGDIGSVTLLDSLTVSNATSGITLNSGTFNANGFNVSLLDNASMQAASGTASRTLAIGSGLWTSAASGVSAWNTGGIGFSVTGTGTIRLNSFSNKTFNGNGVSYSGITLDQGGAGTLTITGNNTFANITNSYSATGATTIALGTTTQRVGSFTASGTLGKLLTISGLNATSAANLILTGSSDTTAQYLNVSNVRMYKTGTGVWNLKNSNNLGSFGAIFTTLVILVNTLSNFFLFF